MTYKSTTNIMRYDLGARVTAVSKLYGADGMYYLSGEQGMYKSAYPVDQGDENFWRDTNNWNVQGAVENDDNKTSLDKRHNGSSKSHNSSTTMSGGSSVRQQMIINSRAAHNELGLFTINEMYIAAPVSDGDIGTFEIYASTKRTWDIQFEVNDPSWKKVASGNLNGVQGILTRISLSRAFECTAIKIIAYSSKKGYMEMSAFKAYGVLIETIRIGNFQKRLSLKRENKHIIPLASKVIQIHNTPSDKDFEITDENTLKNLSNIYRTKEYHVKQGKSEELTVKPLSIKF